MRDRRFSLSRLFRREAAPPAATRGAPPPTEVGTRLRALLLARTPTDPGLPPDELRRGLLPEVKAFLAAERTRIEASHRQGASGFDTVRAQADLADAVLMELLRLADETFLRQAREASPGCAVVALGGFGRRELNPGSDIDVMVLYSHAVDAYVQSMLTHLLYFLWDLGFTVGHSCRSLEDAARMLEADLTAQTSMLEARFLAGSPSLYGAFSDRMWRSLAGRRAEQYIQAKLAEQVQRHEKHGGSVYLQEPNVKEGPGGLRDFHVAIWIARVRHQLADLSALAALGLLSPVELAQCLQALEFLLRVRSELHYLQGGRHDILHLAVQVPIAAQLGFRDGVRFGVERFMQEYYLRAGALHQLSARLVERCARRPGSHVEAMMKRLRARDIGDGFTEVNREIHLPPGQPDPFQDDPVRLLKIFWYRQERGYALSAEAKDAVRGHLALIDEPFRRSNRALGFFLAILRTPAGVAETLRQMHQLGVLTAYIPEFARINCLVQFDYYHRYTVDEHTFVLLDHLEALRTTEEPRLQEFRRIAGELRKPEILKLAVLLHDIGKGEGQGHADRGVAIAAEVLRRMGLPAGDVAAVTFLVAQHLTMAHIAERRDLDDERMIIEFARQVENAELLRMLYLLTYLDINAVGPQVWNDWKATLLWELFIKTDTILTRGIPEGEEEHRRARAVRETLVAELEAEFGAEVVGQHLSLMPVRYILTASSAKVAQHLHLIERVRRGEPVAVQWTAYPPAGYSELLVCAPGAPGRFTSVVGTLTAHGINILSAQLFSRADGVMVRAFQVSDGRGAALEDETAWHRFAHDLRAVILGQTSARDLIRARRRDLLAKPQPRPREVPARVEFDNVVSDRSTVIDIRALDRLGLLYVIASTLSGLGLDVTLAKIATEVDQAVDVFYVTEKDGRKVDGEARMETIRQALVHAIAEGIA